MKGEMVQLKGRGKTPDTAKSAGLVQISRRNFLKLAGVGTTVGVAGCASDAKQNILPYVKPDQEVIPGVAVWYSSTCTECSAGCGIRVRTREGRAVKVEGNPESPINRGSLCALGQASLQSLYDPDRLRQPLKKKGNTPNGPEFEPVSWTDVWTDINEALTNAGNKKAILTGELPAAQADLLKDWTGALGFDHVVWDVLEPVSVAKASEMVFGTYGVPTYHLDKAGVVLNFGADFLETWVNPVGYARQWSDSRRSEHPLRFIHVEPRLSLTGANADMWLKAAPGTEQQIALFLIKALLQRGKGQNLSEDVRAKLADLTKGISDESVEEQTGVAKDKLLLVAQYLAEANTSLVMAGGTAASTENPLPLLVAVNFLNMVLGNVGTTVDIVQVRQPKSSAAKVAALIDDMSAEKVDVLFTYNTNPNFTFPQSFGFDHAVNKVGLKGEGTSKKAGLVVAFSSHLDETAQLADYVIPTNTFLEDWGYVRPIGDNVSLIQPAMTPIFDTKSFGDILLTIAQNLNKSVGSPDIKTFDAYVKAGYRKAVGAKAGSGDPEKFWRASLELGGYFPAKQDADRARVTVSASALALDFGLVHPTAKHGDLVLYPYPSVKSYDGRAANRPWMQELPDPLTQACWGDWAEIHPKTATKFGIAQGDSVIVRNDQGEAHLPVYVTEHVHENIVAIPMGQGHTAYGRYAKSVGGYGGVISLLPKKLAKGVEAIPLLGAGVKISRGMGEGNLTQVQYTESQMDRGLARTSFISGAGAHAHGEKHGHGEGHGEGHGGEHHEPKQMYVQREHPLYQWGMAIDLAACTGCSACVVACYAENNIPTVGKKIVGQHRDMAWLRIERYHDKVPQENGGEELKVSFLPMLCQHCQNAPCEPVCPVYATYHNEEGLNAMIYNRCVGTRYCSNNCSYKVRRFNWFDYEWPELLDWQANPDVPKRNVGVMEKCTFCVQRIAGAKDIAKDLGRGVEDGEITPACVQTCPTKALTFGNLSDPNSRVSKLAKNERAYKVLDHHLNTQPSISYLEDIRYKA